MGCNPVGWEEIVRGLPTDVDCTSKEAPANSASSRGNTEGLALFELLGVKGRVGAMRVFREIPGLTEDVRKKLQG